MLVYGTRLCFAAVMRLWLKGYHRLCIDGLENLPATGSFVLIANHASHMDAICLLSTLPLSAVHRTFPAAASDYFFVKLHRLALAAVVMNALPFDRLAHVRQSLTLCRRLLGDKQSRNVLILFPEGTRSTDGRLRQFKSGIGLVTAGTAVPVVPCYLEGSGSAWPKGSWLPRPRKIRIRIGQPRSYAHLGTERSDIDEIARDLHAAVEALGRGASS